MGASMHRWVSPQHTLAVEWSVDPRRKLVIHEVDTRRVLDGPLIYPVATAVQGLRVLIALDLLPAHLAPRRSYLPQLRPVSL